MATTLNPDRVLNTTPHYTEECFRYPQTIYGRPEASLFYENSERLWKLSYSKAEKAREIADTSDAIPKTARWYQAFLSAYLEHDIEITHILSGWNWNTGYPYIVFGYKIMAD